MKTVTITAGAATLADLEAFCADARQAGATGAERLKARTRLSGELRQVSVVVARAVRAGGPPAPVRERRP